MASLKKKAAFADNLVKNMIHDLSTAMDLPDERVGSSISERQESLLILYQKYCGTVKVKKEEPSFGDLKKNQNQLERRNRQLGLKIQQAEKQHKRSLQGKIEENVLLLKELAEARRQNEDLRNQLRHLRYLTASHGSNSCQTGPQAGEDAGVVPNDALTQICETPPPYETMSPGTVSLSKAPVTRPSSGLMAEPGAGYVPNVSRGNRPASASLQRSFPASYGGGSGSNKPRALSAGAKRVNVYGIGRWRSSWEPRSGRQRQESARDDLPMANIVSQLETNQRMIQLQNEQISTLKAIVEEHIKEAVDEGAAAEDEIIYKEEEGQSQPEQQGPGANECTQLGMGPSGALSLVSKLGIPGHSGNVPGKQRPSSARPAGTSTGVGLGRNRPLSAGGSRGRDRRGACYITRIKP